jgi:hypothetical protein
MRHFLPMTKTLTVLPLPIRVAAATVTRSLVAAARRA